MRTTRHDDDHRDPSLAVDRRVAALLGRMSVREKCFQLTCVGPWSLINPDGTAPNDLDETLGKAPGHVAGFSADNPARLADIVGRMQRQAVTRTRLGIPLLLHVEALNGVVSGGHMVFPTAIGLASTWSPDLVESMADLIRQQMRRLGLRQALAPVMDVALDPRWGRVHETYGEDPYLCAAFSVAYTKGLQGDDLTNGVVATAKHFLGYGLPESGINLSAYEGGTRRTRDLFAYPFEASIQLRGLRSVMNSYGTVDAVPVGVSRDVLTDLLRGTLGFEGFVASDYTTLQHVVGRQRVAADPAEAGRLALAAGLDVELPGEFGYGDVLVGEVEAGRVEVALLDQAVRRVLRAKFELGLFEDPYPAQRIDVVTTASEGSGLSQELARRSLVLLQNDGLLPLQQDTLHVAVIGPHADAVTLQFPTYTYPALREMSKVMASGGFGNAVGVDPRMANWNAEMQPPETAEEFVRGHHGARPLWEAIGAFARSVVTEQGSTLIRDLDGEHRARAVNLASDADVVVLALGGASLWFNGERTEGEASDSADISLPAAQERLANAIAATGKPMAVVLFQGRAYTLPDAVRDASAVLVAPYGGPFGPQAVAEALFGDINPSGRLPYSIPRHTGQVPIYHHQPAGTGYRNPLPPGVDRLYLDMEATPLHPFGAGQSYTSFSLASAGADTQVTTEGEARISATVTNTGNLFGTAVVQLYLRINTSVVTRPAQQLAGFVRVDLEPGALRTVAFDVPAGLLGYTNLQRVFAVEPAAVEWFLGFASNDRRVSGALDVTGDVRILSSSERTFFSTVTVDDD